MVRFLLVPFVNGYYVKYIRNMVFSLIYSIFVWTNVDYTSGTDCSSAHPSKL